MKNAVLMVSAMGNQIYLGTKSKKNPNVMNDSRINFTNQAIGAVIQHMQGLPEGKDCYETPSGRLIWEPKK
jgi:hypothetical protein